MKFLNFSKMDWLVLVTVLMVTAVGFAEDSPVLPAETTKTVIKTDLPVTITTNTASRPARLWNLQDADIISVINEVSQETGKNFVVDPRVSGKISLISSKPLRSKEVYQVFLAILSMLGYSAIPNANVIKIVPNMESGEQATAVATKRYPGRGEEVIVRVIPLENVSSTQLIPILRPLLPQWSNIAAYAPGNVLILLGRANNLERIVRVIHDVDQASNNGIQIVPLRRASAPQLATVLINLQNAARATGEAPGVSIAVDERSNSILLGGPKGMRLKMRVLIAQLDSPAATASGNTEVVYLRYLEAKTFAPILSRIAQNILGKNTGSAGSSDGGMPQYENMQSASSQNNNSSGSTSSTTSSSNSTPAIQGIIQPEPNSNAIIITAPPALMRALKVVIAKLDIRPAQVLVEGIIAEVTESSLQSLGIQWGSVAEKNQPPATGSRTSFPNFGAGVVGIMPSVQLQAVLSILRNQSGVDILSTPSIMVLDNQKATIEIGQMVPTLTGSYSTTGGNSTVQPFQTNDYKNVTLKLDVTPQINLGQSVRLKITLKNDTLQNPQSDSLTPIINTSKIDNSVLINSDDILVIGGLISNSNNENINKVPILGDIPIIAPLFTQKSTSRVKKNLVVFIKPIIVQRDGDGGMDLTFTKYNAMRKNLGNFTQDLSTIGDKPVPTVLPPWKNTKNLPPPFGVHE